MWPVFLDLDILRISIDHSNCVERRRDAGVILDRFGDTDMPSGDFDRNVDVGRLHFFWSPSF